MVMSSSGSWRLGDARYLRLTLAADLLTTSPRKSCCLRGLLQSCVVLVMLLLWRGQSDSHLPLPFTFSHPSTLRRLQAKPLSHEGDSRPGRQYWLLFLDWVQTLRGRSEGRLTLGLAIAPYSRRWCHLLLLSFWDWDERVTGFRYSRRL